MIDPGNRAQLPMTNQSSNKASFIALAVFGVICLLVVLAVVSTIKAYHNTQNSSQEAISVGNSFINDMGQHKYHDARAVLIPQLQTNTSTNKLHDIEMLVEKNHGTFVNLGKPGWFIQDRGGQVTVRLSYPVKFAQSSSTVSLMLIKTSTGYQVYSYYYNF